MEKRLKQDQILITIPSDITIEQLKKEYNNILKKVKDKSGYVTEINIYYKRYETDEEFKHRKYWAEYCKKEQKKKEIALMKEYIQAHKTEALEIVNSLSEKLTL